jgi:hypothetical protein
MSERLMFSHLHILWVNFKLITATSAGSANKHAVTALINSCKDDIPPPLPTLPQHVHYNPPPLSLTIIALGLDPRPGGTWAIGSGVTAVTRGAQFTTAAAGRIIQVGGGGGGGTGLLLMLVLVVGMGVAAAVVATFVLPNGEQGLQGVGGVVVLHGEGVAVGGAGGLALQPAGPGSSLLPSRLHPPPQKKPKSSTLSTKF